MTITGNVLSPELRELLKSMPDPMLKYNFDIYSISAEASIARIIGEQKVKHPQFLAMHKLDVGINPSAAAWNEQNGIDIPVHRLKMIFLDLNFDQAQLDARTAMMNSELSQLVIRQFSGPNVVRYLVFNDLKPESVKFSLDGSETDAAIADRTCTWLFKTMQETKEFPGAL